MYVSVNNSKSDYTVFTVSH